jgi:hypothetical protein
MRSLVLLLAPAAVLAINNGVGRTPAMGYNSWNDFRCNGITAANIMKGGVSFGKGQSRKRQHRPVVIAL